MHIRILQDQLRRRHLGVWVCLWVASVYAPPSQTTVLSPIHTADADETKLFCRVGGVYWALAYISYAGLMIGGVSVLGRKRKLLRTVKKRCNLHVRVRRMYRAVPTVFRPGNGSPRAMNVVVVVVVVVGILVVIRLFDSLRL